jgi:HEAT repeat protein
VDFGEAFVHIGNLSVEELRGVLVDQSADVLMRAAAALAIGRRPGLSIEQRVRWLLESWDSAPFSLQKYILQGLGNCPLPRAIALLKQKLSDPELRLAALKGLATIADEGILPVCDELIRSGTECECRSALSALMTLKTPAAIGLVEAALRSAPSESCRQRAAFLLALNGLPTGEALLEWKLSSLQPLRVESQESESREEVAVDPDYFLTANALAQINNKNGLLALKQLLDILQGNQKVDRQYLMNMTLGIVKMPPTTSFEDWKDAMQRWIDERLQAQSVG